MFYCEMLINKPYAIYRYHCIKHLFFTFGSGLHNTLKLLFLAFDKKIVVSILIYENINQICK